MFCSKILLFYTYKISNLIRSFTHTYFDTPLGGKIGSLEYIKNVIYSSTIFFVFIFFALIGISYILADKNIFTIKVFLFYYSTAIILLDIYVYNIAVKKNIFIL